MHTMQFSYFDIFCTFHFSVHYLFSFHFPYYNICFPYYNWQSSCLPNTISIPYLTLFTFSSFQFAIYSEYLNSYYIHMINIFSVIWLLWCCPPVCSILGHSLFISENLLHPIILTNCWRYCNICHLLQCLPLTLLPLIESSIDKILSTSATNTSHLLFIVLHKFLVSLISKTDSFVILPISFIPSIFL